MAPQKEGDGDEVVARAIGLWKTVTLTPNSELFHFSGALEHLDTTYVPTIGCWGGQMVVAASATRQQFQKKKMTQRTVGTSWLLPLKMETNPLFS